MPSCSARVRRGRTGAAFGLAALTIVVGCALDERELELEEAGSAAGAFDGGGPSGGSSGGPAGGDDGVSGGQRASTGLVDGCADLDTDDVADCDATLVENPSFTTTVDGWRADTHATLSWDARNALDDAPSGSLELSSDLARASAVQCVALAGESVVIVYANAFVEAAEEPDQGRAVLAVTFFEQAACLGDAQAFFETPASAVVGEWATLHAGGLSRPTTRSLSVELVGVKGAAAASPAWYFDNVMLKAQPP